MKYSNKKLQAVLFNPRKLLFLLLSFICTNQVWADTNENSGKLTLAFSTVTVSPSSLSFGTIVGTLKASEMKELSVTISGVSSTAKTTITAPDFYQLFDSPTTSSFKIFTAIGNGTFKKLVRFSGSTTAGSFNNAITIAGSEVATKTIPLTTTVIVRPTFNPSSLFFSTIEGNVLSNVQKISFSIRDVPEAILTTITVPDGFALMATPDGKKGSTFTVAGSGFFDLFFQFLGSPTAGTFSSKLTISGSAVVTQTIPMAAEVLPNPSFSPKSLFFSTVLGATPPLQEVTMTVSNISSGAQTQIQAPVDYSLLSSLTGSSTGRLTFTGNGIFKFFVRFNGSRVPGTFLEVLTITNPEFSTKTFPLKTTVLAVPTPVTTPSTLSGFTAVEGGALSAVQSFDLSITGLPTQGAQFVTVTAPKGYLVSLSGAAATFLNAFILTPANGSIKSKIFVALGSNNPVGPVAGNISITGSQINTKTVAVSGTITAKPQSTLTVDKTSLSSLTTTTNRASATQSYNLKATNLATGVKATVTAPAGFEVSLSNTSGSVFSGQLTVASSAGSINANVFVRLKSQSTTGAKTGTIQNSVFGLTKTVAVSGSVGLSPTLSVDPISLAGFSTIKGQASASKTYTVVASNLAAGARATITAPTNYEVRLQNTGSFASSITLTQSSTGTINQVVEVRLKAITITGAITGTIQNTVAGITKAVRVSGTVAAPVLLLSSTALTGFGSVQNQSSLTKSYTFTATNLATGVTGTVTAPTGYEVSIQGTTTFASSLTLMPTTGTISKTILVRLKAQSTSSIKSGNVINTVAGLSKTVAVSGTVKGAAFTTTKNAIEESREREQTSLVKAFPNPFREQLTVEFEAPNNQFVHFRLLDLSGTELLKKEVVSTGGNQHINLPVGQQRKGVYLLEMVTGTARKTIKLVNQ